MELKVENYTKQIKNKTVLDQVNLTLHDNHIYGLKGENGSGKTMLMRAMIGLIRPTEGSVLLDGQDICSRTDTGIGMLIENPKFKAYKTGYENLKLLSDLRLKLDRDALRLALETVGLDPDDKRKVSVYSLGMKQKLGIAAALMGEPELIFLDEPLNALDERSVKMVCEKLKSMRAEGRIIVISCHDSDLLESMADRIFLIRNGKAEEG